MYETTTRYPSLGRAFDDTSSGPLTGTGPLMIDGLDVVDEQVVALAPIDPTRHGSGRRSVRRAPSPRGVDHGLG